jgi:hypothetical protein
MWNLDVLDIGPLAPAEQLWIIARAVEENGGPDAYVAALRALAAGLEEASWWLTEPLGGPQPGQLRRPG